MRRTATALAVLALLLLAAGVLLAPAFAQPAGSLQGAARLYGYEKASFVSGTVLLSLERGEVAVSGFSTTYRDPLVLMAAKGFDPRGAIRVGELPAGFTGDTSFPLPVGTTGYDTVILLLPSDPAIPVGLGLLR